MAKVAITNIKTLLNEIVDENISVQTAQSYVTLAGAKASQAASSALSAASSKSEVDGQLLAIQSIAEDINQDVGENEILKDFIADLESAVQNASQEVYTNRSQVRIMLDDVITKHSGVLIRYNMINSLVKDFHTRYLGGSLAAPNASWEGMELATGMIYYDIPKNSLMIYVNANKWVPIIEAVNALVATSNLADLPDKEAARVNLNVYSREETITLLEEQDEASEIAFDGTVSGLAAENVQSAVDEIIVQKAQPSGIASLNSSGKVPAAQLPSYVDDVLEVTTYADLPEEGEPDKIYIVVTDEKSNGETSTYRWAGTTYAVVSNTLTAADVKALYESNADTNAYTDVEKDKLANTEITSQLDSRDTANRSTDNHTDGTVNGVYTLIERAKLEAIDQEVATTSSVIFAAVNGREVGVDGVKLDTIEENAKDDQLSSEVPAVAGANVYAIGLDVQTQLNQLDVELVDQDDRLDTVESKLATIEPGATADQTAEEIEALYEGLADTNKYTDAEKDKVNNMPANTDLILGTTTLTRFDKILGSMDILDMEYLNGDLVTVRYTGDNNVNVFYRDVLAYTAGDLTTVKHYYNTTTLTTESGLTTLVYDVNKNLIGSNYTEG